MIWFIYSLSSAWFLATADAYSKKLLQTESALTVSMGRLGYCLPVFWGMSFFFEFRIKLTNATLCFPRMRQDGQ